RRRSEGSGSISPLPPSPWARGPPTTTAPSGPPSTLPGWSSPWGGSESRPGSTATRRSYRRPPAERSSCTEPAGSFGSAGSISCAGGQDRGVRGGGDVHGRGHSPRPAGERNDPVGQRIRSECPPGADRRTPPSGAPRAAARAPDRPWPRGTGGRGQGHRHRGDGSALGRSPNAGPDRHGGLPIAPAGGGYREGPGGRHAQ